MWNDMERSKFRVHPVHPVHGSRKDGPQNSQPPCTFHDPLQRLIETAISVLHQVLYVVVDLGPKQHESDSEVGYIQRQPSCGIHPSMILQLQ